MTTATTIGLLDLDLGSESDLSESFTEKGNRFLCLTGLLISFFGILGNFLCYKTALKLPNQSASAHLIRYLAVWDTIAVVHDGIVDIGFKIFDINLANSGGDLICKLFYYHSWGSTMTASWHLVALAVDRLVVVMFPFWHHSRNAIKVARRISFVCTLINYVVVLPNFYFFSVTNGICKIKPTANEAMVSLYTQVINYGFFSGGPFLLILCANLIFIRELIKTRKKKEKLLKGVQNEGSTSLALQNKLNDMPKNTNEKDEVEKAEVPIGKGPENCEQEEEDDMDNSIYCGPGVYLSTASRDRDRDKDGASQQGNSALGPSVISNTVTSIQRRENRELSNERSLFLMLIVVCGFYLVLTLGGGVLNVWGHHMATDTPQQLSKRRFVFTICEILVAANNSFNFVFFYSSGFVFRKSFWRYVESLKPRYGHNSQV